MQKLFTAPNLAEVGLLKGLLEGQNIACVLRNEYTSIATGSVPFTDTWAELWVANEADLGRARELLDDWQSSIGGGEGWTCPRCGEEIEGQFSLCWNCGTERPA